MTIKLKFTTLSDSIGHHQRLFLSKSSGLLRAHYHFDQPFHPRSEILRCSDDGRPEKKAKLSQFLMSTDTFMGGGSQITFFFVATKDENNDVARIELKACA
jgi:hypothetical protein